MAKKKKDKKKLGILGKIILTLFIILTCLFIYYLLKLQVFPIKMFTIILIELLLANLITFLILRFSKRKIFNIIPILGCAGLFYGVYSLANTNDMLTNMNVNYKTSNYALIVKKESKYQKLEDLENKEISYLADDKDMLKKIKIKYTSKEYDDATKMAMDLLNDNTDSIILEQSYIDLLNDSESSIKNFSDKVKIIYTFEVNTKVTELVKNVNTTKESFVIYLSGIDTYGPVSSVSRTDANMLVVVNPSSKQILLVSIPRDYYVDLAGKNGKDKFTHSGIYGIDTSVKTLEQLFGIDINYYFKINFSSLIKIVDSIDGVDVYSKYTFTSKDGYNYTSGYNHVNGKEALSFTRERKSFAAGDRVRNMNQQAMFEAILRKCTSKSILTKYNSLLNSLKSSFITNMPSNSLTSLIKKQLNDGTKWNVSSIALDGFNGSEYTYSYKGGRLYVMIPDKKTVDAAKEKINEVFDGKVLESSYNDTATNIKTVTKTEKKPKVVVTSNKVSNKVSNKISNINSNKNIIKKYTITYKNGEVVTTSSVDENGKALAPAIPSKDGYEVIGWCLNDEIYDFSTPITSDLVLEAKYKKIELDNSSNSNMNNTSNSNDPIQNQIEEGKQSEISNSNKNSNSNNNE